MNIPNKFTPKTVDKYQLGKSKHIFGMSRSKIILLLLLILTIYLVLNITVKKIPLGQGSAELDQSRVVNSNFTTPQYYLVTKLYGGKKVYFYRIGKCFYGGEAKCAPFSYKEQVPDADPKSFKVLSSYYAIDKDQAYFVWSDYTALNNAVKAIPQVDIDTFEIIDAFYAKDKNYVYRGDEVLHDAKPEDFKIIYKDEPHTYRLISEDEPYALAASNGKLFLGNKIIKYAIRHGSYIINTKYRGIVPCKNERPYTAGTGHVTGTFLLCDLTEDGSDEKINIDANSIKPVSSILSFSEKIFVKDSNHVYFIDTERCTISFPNFSFGDCNYLSLVEGADPESFSKFTTSNYSVPAAGDKAFKYDKNGCVLFSETSVEGVIRPLFANMRCFYW